MRFALMEGGDQRPRERALSLAGACLLAVALDVSVLGASCNMAAASSLPGACLQLLALLMVLFGDGSFSHFSFW